MYTHRLRPLFHSNPRISVHAFRYLPVLLFLCLFCVTPASRVAAQTIYWSPYVTELSTSSATVNWLGADSASGTVDYATVDYYNAHGSFQNTAASQAAGSYQHVPLTGLAPDTAYVYRVRPSDNEDAFSNRTFRTMPVSGPFTFIVISDAHAQDKRFKYVADAIAANETDALFILDGGDYANYDDETLWTPFFQYGDGMLAKFPLVTTIGNHEYHNPNSGATEPTDAAQYHSAYNIPANGSLNYSFDCSGIRFIILNSPDPASANDEDPSLALSQSQVPWLEALLKKNTKGVFTIHHHPIWHYGRAASDSALQPWETLYLQYKISANFSGHVHNYERHSVQGIPHFVLGNAGGKFADMNAGDPYPPCYQVGETRQLGYLKVTVDPAKNTATAQEIFVAWVATDTSETATVYDPPVIFDTITFPLKPKGGGCFIATAAFGSYCAPSVKILRDFRDRFLFTNRPGRFFVNWYCKVSPPLADSISTSESIKAIVRILLLPVVGFAYLCLKAGVPATLLVLLFSAAFIYLGVRRLYRPGYAPHV
jgi:acid phosphatase type 7